MEIHFLFNFYTAVCSRLLYKHAKATHNVDIPYSLKNFVYENLVEAIYIYERIWVTSIGCYYFVCENYPKTLLHLYKRYHFNHDASSYFVLDKLTDPQTDIQVLKTKCSYQTFFCLTHPWANIDLRYTSKQIHNTQVPTLIFLSTVVKIFWQKQTPYSRRR